jgi:peptide/nickel transport system substrate-binding protein
MQRNTIVSSAARVLAAFVAAGLLAMPESAFAKLFRWSSQGDAVTMDPHAFNEGLNNFQNNLVYEFLTQRDKSYKLVPWLATSWENVSPTRWIVKLRKDVKFHDGSAFTAADVVFSFDRARASNPFKLYSSQAGIPRRIDDHTVEFTTPVPNPVFHESIGTIYIMSKAWSEKNGATKPQNLREKEDSFSARNAMGTGPFKLVAFEAGVKTTHRKNPDWWGLGNGHFDGNVEAVEYRPIGNSSTRMAALRSGELDFVLDPPVQEIGPLRRDKSLKLWEGHEIRVVFIGLDQARDELLYGDVKGRNPFKDIRVRKALYQAVDVGAIKSQVMRGLANPTALTVQDPVGAGVAPDLDKRFPYDLAEARRLLTEAGYPKGFGFTLHCPNDRYINDEKICVALSAMWAKIGVNVRVEALPKAQYFPKINNRDTSAYLHGWGGGSSDAIWILKPVLHSRVGDGAGGGGSNNGDFKNPKLDAVIDALEAEMDAEKRRAMVNEAVRIVRDDVVTLPLHRQVIPWASRANVSVVHLPNNQLVLPWVKVR